MAVWNSTTLSNLKSIKDFISEHYQREREINELILNKISSNKVGNYYSESTLNISPIKLNSKWKIFDLSNTLSGFLEGGLNPEIDEVASNKKVGQFNDFIISRLRYYLKEMAIVPNINSNIGLSTEYLVFRNKGVLANEILLPFSLSKYVQSILKWAQTGNEHPRFTSTTFKEIPFPDILIENQEYFQFTIQNAIKLRQQAQVVYKQAIELLKQELGLDRIFFDKKNSYVTSFSEVATTRRLDTTHFQPKFDKLLTHLTTNFDCKKIGYLVSKNRRGLQPNYSSNGMISVVNSKHITSTHLKYDDFEKTTVDDYNSSVNAQIIKGDILIYTTGAYVGATNVYLSEEKALASNHVNILRLKDSEIDSTYLALVLNTTVGKMQTEKHIRGSAQAELYPSDIAKFIVPILSKDKMNEIGSLVRESLKCSQESKRLLEEAKTRVEQLIEEAANKN